MFRCSGSIVIALALAIAACSRPVAPVPKQEAKRSDCVRGEPEALLASNSEFKKVSAAEAHEAVRTGSPVALTIHHFGCAHYALDFEFTWPGARMPAPAVSLGEAADLIAKLPVKEAYRPLMANLATAVRQMAKEPYKQPLRMSETDTLSATTPARNVLRIRYDVAL